MLFPSEGGDEGGEMCLFGSNYPGAHRPSPFQPFFSEFPWLSDAVWLLSLLSPLPALGL